MENITNIPDEKYAELHKKFAQMTIDFFKENGVPENAWLLSFDFDAIKYSVESGKWCPASDSSLTLFDAQRNALMFEM